MILNAKEVKRRYRKTAGYYDLALSGYRLLGIERERKSACESLRLKSGDTVVDLGCGTGANLPYLHQQVGRSGRIIAVDLSGAMLEKARKRIERNDWKNVDLVEADIRQYKLPENASGVIAAFALEMVPEYDEVVQHISENLPHGGRLGLIGVKEPERWPDWLVNLGIALNSPFGVSRDYADLKPWESVRRHMTMVKFQELMFGAAYRCVGEKR